eukprot:TRINITY_DN4182_c0_g1_i5.p2 TRINITY_DN4182_c0_g1~~TRINITY_DN4182_c0_g1_i5.p2  ORF type:complete len:171 (+),score=41.30 TRINITY_DN4182_c0_g1_i5:568-1080(+)
MTTPEQLDELCALHAVFPDYFEAQSQSDDNPSEFVLKIPIGDDGQVYVRIEIQFPETYPSSSCPKILEISILPFGIARWKEGHASIDAVTKIPIQKIWLENDHEVMMYQYVEWLRENCFQHLALRQDASETKSATANEAEEFSTEIQIFHGEPVTEKKSNSFFFERGKDQ